jgi:hypothetical protein
MVPLPKHYAVQLLEEAAGALAGGSSYQQALSAEISEAIKYSVYARIRKEHRAGAIANKPPRKEKPARAPKVRPASDVQRLERIAAMCAEGKTLNEIGAVFKITHQRVQQIIKRHDIKRSPIPPKTKTLDAAKAKRDAWEARCIARWGVGIEGTRQLNAAGLINAFKSQRGSAIAHGYGWELSFIDWHAAWIASGKLEQRGLGGDNYAMTRADRSQPFKVGNLKIVTIKELMREVRARTQGNVAPRTGVYCLYPGLSKPWVARLNRKTVGHFETAEMASAAREQALAGATA